jgi:hypothetical protein
MTVGGSAQIPKIEMSIKEVDQNVNQQRNTQTILSKGVFGKKCVGLQHNSMHKKGEYFFVLKYILSVSEDLCPTTNNLSENLIITVICE